MPLERAVIRHELVRREVVVRRRVELSPGMVRITLGGDELAGFAADGPADHVKLLFPATDRFPAAARDYTPLASRPGELDIDLVVHGDEGPATSWARAAAVGDPLTVGGPRGSRLLPDGMSRLVIVADGSALPAASRWIRMAPAAVPIDVLQRTDGTEGGYLDQVRAHVTHVPTDGELEPALRALAPFDDRTFLFLAGEAGALIPLRRYLRRELGLPAEQVQASGYWRRGVAGLDHHAPVDPSDPD
jgi:NADPH-dependent ferric siderophore reductase